MALAELEMFSSDLQLDLGLTPEEGAKIFGRTTLYLQEEMLRRYSRFKVGYAAREADNGVDIIIQDLCDPSETRHDNIMLDRISGPTRNRHMTSFFERRIAADEYSTSVRVYRNVRPFPGLNFIRLNSPSVSEDPTEEEFRETARLWHASNLLVVGVLGFVLTPEEYKEHEASRIEGSRRRQQRLIETTTPDRVLVAA